MLLSIDENNLTKEERAVIEKMQKNNTAKVISWIDAMVEEEAEHRAEYDMEGYTEKILAEAKREFRKAMENNLDKIINDDYFYNKWNECIENVLDRKKKELEE